MCVCVCVCVCGWVGGLRWRRGGWGVVLHFILSLYSNTVGLSIRKTPACSGVFAVEEDLFKQRPAKHNPR